MAWRVTPTTRSLYPTKACPNHEQSGLRKKAREGLCWKRGRALCKRQLTTTTTINEVGGNGEGASEGGRQIVAGSSNQRIGGSRAIRCGWYTLVAHMARESPRKEGKERGGERGLCFCNKTTQERRTVFLFSLSLPLPYLVGPSPSSASSARGYLTRDLWWRGRRAPP